MMPLTCISRPHEGRESAFRIVYVAGEEDCQERGNDRWELYGRLRSCNVIHVSSNQLAGCCNREPPGLFSIVSCQQSYKPIAIEAATARRRNVQKQHIGDENEAMLLLCGFVNR